MGKRGIRFFKYLRIKLYKEYVVDFIVYYLDFFFYDWGIYFLVVESVKY